jgi:2-polyprenyl-3-methyl-5-hydroxy-6-metoxy-1,4-benzoquinol methylase
VTAGAAARADADVETSSARYALRFSGGVGRWFLERQAALTIDLLRPFPAARVVDVGGGHGQLVRPLLDAGHAVTVYASDASACSDDVRALAAASRIALQTGDLLRAPFPDRAFDVALCFRLLPHARDWTALAVELARLAARAVIVDYPTTRSVNAVSGALFALKHRVEGDTRPFKVFREAEITSAFAAAGLHHTARRPQFFFPMALHRATRSAALARTLEGAAGMVGLTRALGSPVILRLERSS